MKKSELRHIIRECIREELSKSKSVLQENFVDWNISRIAEENRATGRHGGLFNILEFADMSGYKFVYDGTKEVTSLEELLAYYRKVDSEYGRLFNCSIDDDLKEVRYGSYSVPLW